MTSIDHVHSTHLLRLYIVSLYFFHTCCIYCMKPNPLFWDNVSATGTGQRARNPSASASPAETTSAYHCLQKGQFLSHQFQMTTVPSAWSPTSSWMITLSTVGECGIRGSFVLLSQDHATTILQLQEKACKKVFFAKVILCCIVNSTKQ